MCDLQLFVLYVCVCVTCSCLSVCLCVCVTCYRLCLCVCVTGSIESALGALGRQVLHMRVSRATSSTGDTLSAFHLLGRHRAVIVPFLDGQRLLVTL